MKKKEKRLFASVMLLIATMLWGMSYCIQTISAANLGTFTIVFLKGVGVLGLIPLIIVMKQKFNRHTFIGGILMGIFAFTGCACQQKGMMLSSVSKASFITVLYIVIVPLIEIFIGKKLKRRMFLAIFMALVGLYFLCMSGSFTLNLGDLYLLCGAFCFAMQILIIDRYVEKCDSLALSFVAQIFGSVLAGIIMMTVEKPVLSDFTVTLLPVLYMIFLSGAFAQTIQVVYQEYIEASLASLIMSLESVFGAIFGWLVLGQVLTLKEIVGCILVFVAILIAE
ncbi:MAG: DMT family transporter [Erysipelotrichaceae bacterium]|nr:DMT family transporter [Erysipelotrichaceae bacterium]